LRIRHTCCEKELVSVRFGYVACFREIFLFDERPASNLVKKKAEASRSFVLKERLACRAANVDGTFFRRLASEAYAKVRHQDMFRPKDLLVFLSRVVISVVRKPRLGVRGAPRCEIHIRYCQS